MSNNITNNTECQGPKDIEQKAIDEINTVIEESGLFKDLSEEKRNRLKATIKSCVRVGYLLLQQVFNKGYYPLMNDSQEEILLIKFLLYTVLNVAYPYTKDAVTLKHIIKMYKREMEDFCVDTCLLYILDESTDLYNMLGYLSETFYNIY